MTVVQSLQHYAELLEMKLVAALVLIVWGISLASAQLPHCQSPPRWRANILRIEPTRRLEIRGRIAYDAVLERFRILEDETSPVEPEDYYGRYYYFQEKVYYSVNLKTRQCYRLPLYNETFRPIGVPFDAKLAGTGVIGTSALEGAGVAVDSWYGNTDEGGRYLGTVTNVGCIPVSDHYYSQTNNFFASTFFYDVAEGFNPDDFVLPTFCFE